MRCERLWRAKDTGSPTTLQGVNRTVLTNATLTGLGAVSIVVNGGIIAEIASAEQIVIDPDDEVIDLHGRLVLPALVEPHAHLDKAFLSDRIDNPTGDLIGAISAMEANRSTINGADVADRAERAARLMAACGVTKIRSHVDTTLATGLEGVLGLIEAKRRCADVVDIEIAVLLDWPLTGLKGRDRFALARDALDAGADVIGGCPHLDQDPVGAVHALVDFALEHSVPLDLHADENLRPDSNDLGTLARRILDDGLTIRANASHCVSLCAKPISEQRRIAAEVAAAGVSVTSLPQTNLYLQARDLSTGPARGVAPLDILRDAGVVIAAGGDNLQDPFNPIGSGDPLETAALCVWVAHQNVQDAFDLVSRGSALSTGGMESMRVGTRADLFAIAATSVREAIAFRTPDRLVMRAGRFI